MTSRIITLDERFAGPKPEPWSVVALPPAATETAERCADFELALQQQVKAAGISSHVSVHVNWSRTLTGRPIFDGKRKSCVKFTSSWSDSARQEIESY